MNRSHVTLPQILAAASTRYANMVPESAAYLILALCDAIGCLPLIVPDAAIEMSAEGAVSVTQQGKVVAGPEASQAMRELFVRLLGVTTGPTPRLAAVARPRELSAERGVDTFAAEVEAALVPMNRAAGKRSLGRLARETLRAIDSGNLALHLQVRAASKVVAKEAAKEAPKVAAKEEPAAVPAAIAPLVVAPIVVARPLAVSIPQSPITPPPSLTSTHSNSGPFNIPITPTTPGLGLETMATEAHVDSGVFGATPTYKEGDSISVEPTVAQNGHESPAFDATTGTTVLCEATQLSAHEVQIGPAIRTPSSEQTTRVFSTNHRPHRMETPPYGFDITLNSAGVEPILNGAFETPAPSAPDDMALQIALGLSGHDFSDCHDGQTQSAPKYRETLPGLAPITPAPSAPEGPNSAEPLQSFEYILVTPSSLPKSVRLENIMAAADALDEVHEEIEKIEALEEIELSPGNLVTASPSFAMLVEEQEEPAPMSDDNAPLHGFRELDLFSEKPGRVDELLGTFGRSEESDDEMLRKTASSLKEMAGLEPTPYAPSVLPAIRVPFLTNRKSPAWLPEIPREAPTLEPAPLVENPRGWRAKLMVPLSLFIALFAGFAVVHWRLPETVQQWVHPIEAKQPAAAAPAQAAAEQETYVEP